MEHVVRVFDCFAAADAADLAEWLELSGEARMRIGEEMRADVFPDGRLPFVRELVIRQCDEL